VDMHCIRTARLHSSYNVGSGHLRHDDAYLPHCTWFTTHKPLIFTQTATTAVMILAEFPKLVDFCSGLSQAFVVGRDSSVGIATRYRLDSQGFKSLCGGEIVSSRPDQAWGSPSFQFKGYRVSFQGVKQLVLDLDHPRESSKR